MTQLRELWNTYSSQELFGESLREEDPALFDELDAAITAAADREKLVQEVLERYNALTACALNGQTSCENEDAALFDALRQLQDWSAAE